MDYSPSSYFSTNYNERDKKYEEPVKPPVLERTRVAENVQRQELINWQDVRVREPSLDGSREKTNIRNIEGRKELPFEKREKKYKEFVG